MSFSLKIAAVLAAGASAYTSVNISQCKDAAKDLDKSNLSNQNMFDPEMLERGAKAIRDIDRSANAKAVRSATIFYLPSFSHAQFISFASTRLLDWLCFVLR